MNTESKDRIYNLFRKFKNFPFLLDGSEPLRGGSVEDPHLGELEYVGGPRGGFYRYKEEDGGENAAINTLMFELTSDTTRIIISTFSVFRNGGRFDGFDFKNRRPEIFQAGITIKGNQEFLINYYLGNLHDGESWIQVGKYWIGKKGGSFYYDNRGIPPNVWVQLNSSITIKITETNDSPYPSISLAGLLKVGEELPPNNGVMAIFTTRLPTKPLIQQIVAPEIPPLTARTLAKDFTPKLREATAKEKEIFESLLTSS